MIDSVVSANDSRKYYSIGEVAKLLNVSTSLIRFWEKNFSSLQPRKNEQGARRYTRADIAQLSKIHQLVKKQGYTLKGAKEAIKRDSNKLKSNTEIIHALKLLKEFLVSLRENMTSTK